MDSTSVARGLLYGGISSCIAECFTLPVDLVKTRMQLQGPTKTYKNSINAFFTVVRFEGVFALWNGLSPALLRQSVYGSMRYGLYGPFKKLLGVREGDYVPLWKKVAAGSAAGALSSVVANTTDLVKVRMQASGMAGAQKRSYKGVIHALWVISKEEGFLGLWKGVGPTCGRATALAAVELSSYDEIKTRLLHANVFKEGLQLHLGSALGAGFLASLASSPFDVVKSRVMEQPVTQNGKGLHYKGMIDCFVKTVRKEGVLALWKGFWPNYARVGPRVAIVFVVMEQLKAFFH